MTYELIMVTDWIDHWDKLPNNRAYYTVKRFKQMFEGEPITDYQVLENARTTFIKIDSYKSRVIEKAWVGTVSEFRPSKNKIWFTVNLHDEKPIEELEDENLDCNCYIYEVGEQAATQARLPDISNTPIQSKLPIIKPQAQVVTKLDTLLEPLFDALLHTSDPNQFEDGTQALIKLLVSNSYKVPQRDEAGKADGFFQLGDLMVLWDVNA